MMAVTETSAALVDASFPEGSVEAGVYATYNEGFEHSLVVLAMGEACWLVTAAGGHHLRVAPAVLPAVRQQLACFDRESVGWPPKPATDTVSRHQHLPMSPLFWMLGVILVFHAQEKHPEITEAGLLDSGRMLGGGEWFRVATALWLHDDLGHLVSNIVCGLMMFSAVVMTFGRRAGWGLIVGASLAGNLATVLLHAHEEYRSLGASTAVFAALGLLVGRAIHVMSRTKHPYRWRAMLVPFASGLATLGLYGASGAHTDVLAHAMGFTAGLVLGFVAMAAPAAGPRPTTDQRFSA